MCTLKWFFFPFDLFKIDSQFNILSFAFKLISFSPSSAQKSKEYYERERRANTNKCLSKSGVFSDKLYCMVTHCFLFFAQLLNERISIVVCVLTDEKNEEITNLKFSFTSQECSRNFFFFRHDCLTSCHKNL